MEAQRRNDGGSCGSDGSGSRLIIGSWSFSSTHCFGIAVRGGVRLSCAFLGGLSTGNTIDAKTVGCVLSSHLKRLKQHFKVRTSMYVLNECACVLPIKPSFILVDIEHTQWRADSSS